MIHARDDYNRIQDPAGLIPDNEPVCLFRAQDKHFAAVMEFYASLVEMDGGQQEIIRSARAHAELGRQWPVKKTPDMPT
jgi:hypothetical protein